MNRDLLIKEIMLRFHCGWSWVVMLLYAIWPEGKLIYIMLSVLFMCMSFSYVAIKPNDKKAKESVIINAIGTIALLSLFSLNIDRHHIEEISFENALIFCMAIVSLFGTANSQEK